MHLLRRSRTSIGALVLLAAAACSSSSDHTNDNHEDPFEPLPKVEYSSGSVPQDRDQDAVTAALARIDPCALVDPAGVGLRGYPGTLRPEANGPHVCETINADEDRVRVAVGVELPPEERFNRQLITLGGAKAYVAKQSSIHCQVALPVSFSHAIEFTGSSMGVDADACAAAKGFAAAAAKRLAHPEDVELGRARDRWPMCDLLGQALGDRPNGTELRFGTDSLDGMDTCGLWQRSGGDFGTGTELEPVAADVSLQVEYGDPEPEPDEFGTVNGRALSVYRYASATGCMVGWKERPTLSGGGERRAAWFHVAAPSCSRARKTAAGVTGLLDSGRPVAAQPQRPVLYASAEPDVAAAGGCVDLRDQAPSDCAPYVPAEVPDDPVETIRAAEADPNVNCALALDAVREQFGERMRPVTAVHGTDADGAPGYACGFLEASHSRQVWIRASSDPMGQDAGSHIDGRPAHDVTTRSDGIRQLWVALDGTSEPGHLYAEVLVTPDRRLIAQGYPPVDKKPLQRLDELMADVMAEHF